MGIYQEGSDRSKTQGLESAKVSVREESTQKGTKIASAIEDIDEISCTYCLHVKY